MNANDDRRAVSPDYLTTEPEIIPPGAGDRYPRSQVWIWTSDREGVRATSISPPGPFTAFVILALFALIVALVLAVFLGAVLIWIPVLVVVLGAALAAAAIRRRWMQIQHWLQRR